jgi:hypothetical protein
MNRLDIRRSPSPRVASQLAAAVGVNMTPKYEIKFLLDAERALDITNNIKESVLTAFAITEQPMDLKIHFLDTDDKQLHHSGWTTSICQLSDEPDLELTYQRRYKIVNGDFDAALTAARRDGFHKMADKWEAWVDWGNQKQTLSIHKHAWCGGTRLPNLQQSRAMLVKQAPKIFDAVKTLEQSRIYGPIYAHRYSGTWELDELDIDVWPIKDKQGTGEEYLIEVTLKGRRKGRAKEQQVKLMKFLKDLDVFSRHDSLRPSLIMERY